MGHADYTQGTGAGGVMLIRVADAAGTPGVIGGNEIQFHIRAGSSATWVGSPGFKWNGFINGAWGPDGYRGYIGNISGTTWRHVATFHIGYTQDVCFHIDYSGTQGFGGPTDFWLRINRPTPPGAPNPIGLDQITTTSMRYRFSGTTDGGSPILEWQAGYGTNPNGPQFFVGSNGTSVIGGLTPATEWFFWSRGRNAVDWGPWSARVSARTLAAAYVGKGGSFPAAAAVAVGKGGAFPNAAEVRVGKGGSFVPAN